MIDSIDAFKERIKEIDILLTYARNNQRTLLDDAGAKR